MHERISAEIERIERKYPNPMSKEEVFELLDHFCYVIPQGGPMTGIGNNLQVASLSNCFVIGHKHPADSSSVVCIHHTNPILISVHPSMFPSFTTSLYQLKHMFNDSSFFHICFHGPF